MAIDLAGSLPKHALELFECPSIGGKPRLTRTSCGQRHKAARRTAKPTRGPLVTPWLATCGGCEIGAAHARGERPDVTAAQLVRSREVVEMSAKGQTYTHEGKTLTLGGWAREPGVTLSEQALRSRVERGWTIADALATPKGAPRPSTSPAKRRAPSKGTPKSVWKASPEQVTAAAERIEHRAERSLVEDVRATVASVPVAELLTRLGYVVEDAGLVPAGRLLLVRGAA